MKNKLLSVAIVATLGLSALAAPGMSAYASKLSDLKEKKNEISEEKSSLQSSINETNSKINELQKNQDKLKAEITNIDHAVEDANNKLREKNNQIEATNAEIDKLKGEIVVLQERIETRNELLKDRARSYQKNGGTISYLDVLLGAQSFSDFIDRMSAVAAILDADKGILDKHNEDKKSLEDKETQMAEQLIQLENTKKEIENLKVKLNEQKVAKDKLLGTLELEKDQLHAEKYELEDEKGLLAAQEKAIQAAIALEQKRLAEANKPKNSGSTSSAPPASSGTFMTPTRGILTSPMGPRWGSYHAGIDIASRAANHPVVAAADGVIIRSNYSSSYGNVVFISHSINGQIYTTVYAHLQTRFVSNGQVVSKGQTLGYMGNTGNSTGQHLHFEIHKGPWSGSRNVVNPLNYIKIIN